MSAERWNVGRGHEPRGRMPERDAAAAALESLCAALGHDTICFECRRPVRRDARLYDRLSAMPVWIVYAGDAAS